MRLRFPLYYKIAGAAFAVALALLAFLTVLEYRDQRRALQEKFGLTLQHVAQTTALFLDGAAHERVRGPADAAGADFAALRALLDRVRWENSLREDQIYTLRPVDGRTDEWEFVVMLQARTFVGSRYPPPPVARAVIERVLRDGFARHTPIYTDQHGSYVSAYAPIRAGGRVVALLEVDYAVDQFVAELGAGLRGRLWIVPASLALALALALLVAQSITRAVRRLVDATEAVRGGRYDGRVDVRTRDELRTLAEAFNEMIAGLRERFAMLKFVPRHTRALIAESARGEQGPGLARRRDVTIFFSDIRGFTALSDRLPPERVIEMLNIYLREEAEIIERLQGSVDKYIGDAVMALFEGPERYERAVEAAVEIQRAIAALNERHAFEHPVQVGVGIAGGEVVLGSIGYEGRLEFAVVGRMVNLASRLTAVAGPGEIVVSDVAWERLGQRYVGERVDGLKLKGFHDEVTCYRIRVRVDEAAAPPGGVP